jgi:hypothetical protein
MSFYIEEAKTKGFVLDEVIKTLKELKEGEEVILRGIRAVCHVCCYSLWSSKGMMRLGLDLDPSSVALALITLLNRSNFDTRGN